MTKEHELFLAECNKNELYKKSAALHKEYQHMRFLENGSNKALEGQRIRREDKKGLIEGEEGFDINSAYFVIYNFKDGVLHDNDNTPAVQSKGHWEHWINGEIIKIISKGGDTEEYWSKGVPVRIDTNLSERRNKGE